MLTLRIVSIFYFIAVAALTYTAVSQTGWNLSEVFIGDVAAMNWSGQFNIDFMAYLTLSAIWVGWRHKFSGLGIALMPLAQVGGILFFTPYLLWAISQAGGDPVKLLLGDRAANA
ncbi:MAG: hypothetical protein ACFB0Z_08915 [Candidatus Phaeomarinobacter sp.]